MPPEVKYLGNGDAVLVLGDAPPGATSTDGGRTLTEVDQVYVARLDIEAVEAAAVLDTRPEYDPETATWVQAGDEPAAGVGAGTPSGASDAGAAPARGEAMTADQLQAEIDRLQAEKAAVESNASVGGGSQGGSPAVGGSFGGGGSPPPEESNPPTAP